jgi:hypothetical protein
VPTGCAMPFSALRGERRKPTCILSFEESH